MTTRRRRKNGRIALRGNRWYGDFREFADVGGRIEALKLPGHGYGTQDRDIAIKLGAERLEQLEQLRRNKHLLGREKTATLAEYATHHLRAKGRADKVRYQTVLVNEQQLRTFITFVGADRPLESITTEDIQRFDGHLSTLRGISKGTTLSGQTRRHYLNRRDPHAHRS